VTYWLSTILAVALPVLVIVTIVLTFRRSRHTGRTTPVVSFTLWLSAVWAGLSVIAALIALLVPLLSPAVTLTVPVQEYWPALPGVVTDPREATIVSGGFTSVELSIEGLAPVTRWLWAIGSMIGALLPGAIAALIALMCFQLLRGQAFAPVVARGATITAVIIAVGGISSQILCQMAGSTASQQVLGFSGAEVTGYPDEFDLMTALPQPTYDVHLDFWPIGAALALAALAAVLRYGSRLQRDTELLV
jgi:hypothetical protein